MESVAKTEIGEAEFGMAQGDVTSEEPDGRAQSPGRIIHEVRTRIRAVDWQVVRGILVFVIVCGGLLLAGIKTGIYWLAGVGFVGLVVGVFWPLVAIFATIFAIIAQQSGDKLRDQTLHPVLKVLLLAVPISLGYGLGWLAFLIGHSQADVVSAAFWGATVVASVLVGHFARPWGSSDGRAVAAFGICLGVMLAVLQITSSVGQLVVGRSVNIILVVIAAFIAGYVLE